LIWIHQHSTLSKRIICLVILFRVKHVGYHLKKINEVYIGTRHFLNSIRKSML